MQKILRRVATAERVVAKRKKKDTKIKDKKNQSRQRERRMQQLSVLTAASRQSKQATKDAWELGPLAPRYDVGRDAGTRGSIQEQRFTTYPDISKTQLEARCAWAGGSDLLCLAVNDRVVVMEGPDKGRIGKVTQILLDKGEVYVEGLNKSNISIDVDIRRDDIPPVLSAELPIAISRVRLVHPIKDPETGETKDVIINRIEPRNQIQDRYTGKRRWSRVVPGLNAGIPWPEKDDDDTKEKKADTLRIDVEEKTFVPTLLRPPMPESLIDELRGKYSRFRTRHDPEYVARLEAEEQAKQDRKKLMDTMRTPLQEFHRAEREKKKKKGKPRLTIEMLEKIGEVMARNMERQRNGGALLEESSEAAENRAVPDAPIGAGSEDTPPPPSS
ncbi:hypothetical protein F5B19DRAFT_448469 [Rostrohypoxylon terebratum]|nr:hypothetical protein F5B19DRAFT_448469 [Rostrohypoxylon terebratum]